VPPPHEPHLGKATMDVVFVPQLEEAALARMADQLASVVRAAVAAGMAVGMADAIRDAEGDAEAELADSNECGCLSRGEAA
jgi:hypothetical protein